MGPHFVGYRASSGNAVEILSVPLFAKVRSLLRSLFQSRRVEEDLDEVAHAVTAAGRTFALRGEMINFCRFAYLDTEREQGTVIELYFPRATGASICRCPS